MTLLYPSMLWWLMGAIPLVGLQFLHLRNTRIHLHLLGGRWTDREVSHVFFIKWFLSTIFLTLFYVSVVLSLSGMSWGEVPVEEDRQGLDLTFVVDVSRSMLSQDVPPSRMATARELIRGLVQEFNTARFALIAFSGEPLSMIPMTEDGYAIENALTYLGPNLITSPGTNIQTAIESGLESIPEGSNRHRIILLFTDGESLTGSIEELIPRLEREGIPILAVGIGSLQGGTIPLGEGQVLLHPETGEPVVSRLNEEALRQLAGISDSSFLRTEGPGAYTQLSEWIRKIESTRDQEGFRLQRISRYDVLLGIALICLLGYLLVFIIRIRGIL